MPWSVEIFQLCSWKTGSIQKVLLGQMSKVSTKQQPPELSGGLALSIVREFRHLIDVVWPLLEFFH